jgi:diguanylate cyclase
MAVLVWGCLLSSVALAEAAIAQRGSWYEAPSDPSDVPAPAAFAGLPRVAEPARTGGRYWYRGEFVVAEAGTYVIDFRNATTIGAFRHLVLDGAGHRVADLAGGIERREVNPFMLRHGREVELTAGRYTLLSELSSPFLLSSPVPHVSSLATYREAIKLGNAVALVGLGILLGLCFYYAALTLARRRLADCMYALFILGNVLYNGAALLLFSDLFGIHWFYLVSLPILLLSNFAYVLFVVRLLEIRPDEHPLLYRCALALLALFGAFLVVAAVRPNWSLELDRYAVGLFSTYGLIAAIVRTRAGNPSARWYLVAVTPFVVLGGLSISLSHLDAEALTVEHLGLTAVVVEAALLALVLAHQFALLHQQRDSAEDRAQEGYRIAYRDALTGLPNRYRLESDMARLPSQGSLTFIDLDGLKHYNERYGHQRGDELLCGFAEQLAEQLGTHASVYRLSGDEFAVASTTGDLELVERRLDDAISALRQSRFQFAGASFGSVRVHEDPTRQRLKQIADGRMVEQKRQRRASAPAEWPRGEPDDVEGGPSEIRRNSRGSDDAVR